jgi:hypothetical protein
LHSTTLAFTHSRSGEWIVVNVPLPEDLMLLVPEGTEL